MSLAGRIIHICSYGHVHLFILARIQDQTPTGAERTPDRAGWGAVLSDMLQLSLAKKTYRIRIAYRAPVLPP